MIKEKSYLTIVAPHLTEKSSVVMEANNQYVFKVASTATKLDVKEAVEEIFKVKVVGVQVLNRKPKVKRTMKGYSKRGSFKKAYVSLAEGETIDFTSF